ncbi:MAG TPA: tetratricopeptide repeat protein [Anaerolineales bacterium]|nr:tetratricopeptide repeat protein [Anaerolineales bacterium]
MTRKRGRRPNFWRILALLTLIGAAFYVDRVVVPATPPLFIPTATPTRNPESFIAEADAFLEEGKLTQAIAAYEKAVRSDPYNVSIYLSLARAQMYTNQYEPALENAKNALVRNNANPLGHTLKAWALDYLKNYTEAEASIKQALELDPDSAFAHAVYAEILMDKALVGQGDIGVIDQAAEESRLAKSLDPSLMEARRARGYVLWKTGNFAEAIEEYKAALAINDKIANLHLALGFNYHALGEYDQAVQSYLQAYALNPTDPSALYQISRTYYTVGDFSQSVQYADQAVQADPTDPSLHGNLGVMHYKNNQLDLAVTELSLAIHGGTLQDGSLVEGIPLNYGTVAEFYAVYGLALAKSDHCSQAVPIFQAIRTNLPNDEINSYNAEYGLLLCQEGVQAGVEAAETISVTSAEVTATPESLP